MKDVVIGIINNPTGLIREGGTLAETRGALTGSGPDTTWLNSQLSQKWRMWSGRTYVCTTEHEKVVWNIDCLILKYLVQLHSANESVSDSTM